MKLNVTARGVRYQKREYERKFGLTRNEAARLKKKGSIHLRKDLAEKLIDYGLAVRDDPVVEAPVTLAPEPAPLVEPEIESVESNTRVDMSDSSAEITEQSAPLIDTGLEEQEDLDG